MTDSGARRTGGPDIDRLKAIPLMRVLDEYGLLNAMFERDSTASGLSLFSGGVLRADLKLNIWSDSKGRPVIGGRMVAGDVVGLVQAIEGVGQRRALEILHEHFVLGNRGRASTVLGRAEFNTALDAELEGFIADVPYLRYMGVPPAVAEAWSVGWCGSGPMRGRIAFPIRRPTGVLVGYAGLDPTDPERWRFTEGLKPELELFGIDRIHREANVKQAALKHGLTLVNDPLEVLRVAQCMSLPVVSPMSPELSRTQIQMLLDPAINPMGQISARGEGRQGWALAVRRSEGFRRDRQME